MPKFLTVTLCDATLYLANVKSNRNAKDRNTVAAMADSAFLSKNLQIVERINTKLPAHKRNETVSPFFRICNHERSKDMQKYQKYKKRDKRYSRLILKEGSCR